MYIFEYLITQVQLCSRASSQKNNVMYKYKKSILIQYVIKTNIRSIVDNYTDSYLVFSLLLVHVN